MIIGNSFLTSLGVPIAGELDLKNCIAMLIMDRFGAGGSFAEFHPVDFAEDFVLVGHDGPHHLLIADGTATGYSKPTAIAKTAAATSLRRMSPPPSAHHNHHQT